MPPSSVDIMLSHDWPSEMHKFGNEDELMPRFRCWFEDDPEYRVGDDNPSHGSLPVMRILKHLKPKYWFSGHIHRKYSAIFEGTKFLASDICELDKKFLQIIDDFEPMKSLQLNNNPKRLAILKWTNELQSASYEMVLAVELLGINVIFFKKCVASDLDGLR